MKNLQVTQVALGKAHAVALTSKGIVYTFGINNKGQCGRDFAAQVKEGLLFLKLDVSLMKIDVSCPGCIDKYFYV